jgi:hypothetical protein
VKVDDAWWLVSVINTRWLRDAVAEASGMDLADPGDDAGHVEIYRADVVETPLFRPELIDPNREGADDLTLDDYHDVQWGIRREITPIDADGDPLNGLTPEVVLPHGHTLDDAIAWITAGGRRV